jgi:hypothetical protein
VLNPRVLVSSYLSSPRPSVVAASLLVVCDASWRCTSSSFVISVSKRLVPLFEFDQKSVWGLFFSFNYGAQVPHSRRWALPCPNYGAALSSAGTDARHCRAVLLSIRTPCIPSLRRGRHRHRVLLSSVYFSLELSSSRPWVVFSNSQQWNSNILHVCLVRIAIFTA